MDTREAYLKGARGVDLFCCHWRPEGKVRASVVVVHGIGEHCGRYGNLVNALVPAGFAVHAFDHRGHGRSSGPRGHIRRWRDFRQDVGRFLESVQIGAPRPPLFLLGHSMGGLIAIDYCLREAPPIQGLIASAPPLGEIRLPKRLMTACRFLNRVWPRLSLSSPLDVAAISRDSAAVKAYRDDPLVHSRGTPRLAMEMIRAAAWAQDHAEEMLLPLLLIHGSEDRLTQPEESESFFIRAGSPDKLFLRYPGGYHELHNDIIKDRVLADVTDWLEAHL